MNKAKPYILFISLFAYLIIVLTFASVKRKEVVCKDLHVEIKDTEINSFIEDADVERLIRSSYGEIIDRPVDQIDKDRIEQVLISNSVIKSAQVYNSLDGSFHVEVTQRRPILRVMSHGGYYVDEDGEIMPLSNKYTARVLIASGNISREFACKCLYPYVLSLRKDKFWDAYIEQIIVKDEDNIVLIPKVGNFTIILGSLGNAEEKMRNLRSFLKEGIVKKGWNTYKEINLKFDKQIV
ncbi:cell division protein FtsQ, partial [Odoribacter sp. OttesenSCG-928-G04]|nr:cell division protein FtsQ [Odoribacter sp. OttesenSCG-928-G04]